MRKLFLAIELFLSIPAFAGGSRQYVIGVHGSSSKTENIFVTVTTSLGKQTHPVSKNDYHEFCWSTEDGYGTITKEENDIIYQYNWNSPDDGALYKEIWIDGANWTKQKIKKIA